jgi:hypothetical protein
MTTTHDRDDNAAIRDLVKETIEEIVVFSKEELSQALINQGLYGETSRLSRIQYRRFKVGVKEEISQILHRWKDNAGRPMCFALDEGEKAEWKLWARMDRRESRRAYALLERKHKQVGKQCKMFRKAHQERFREDPADYL